jgi:hypothetical protein
MTTELKTFMCVFCKYRSHETHIGCPRCGRRYGYGEVRTVKAIQLAQAIIFTVIGGFLIVLGLVILVSELRLPYAMAPWWTFTVIFGFGALFVAGGLSSFFGNSWLLGLLLILFAGNVPYSKARRDSQ